MIRILDGTLIIQLTEILDQVQGWPQFWGMEYMYFLITSSSNIKTKRILYHLCLEWKIARDSGTL